MVLLAVHISDVHAIDFVDHTGYTPDWAQTLGSYQTLARCSEIAGESSADGNWCFEWTASVVDQGSVSQAQPIRPTTDLVERTCTVNVVCVFPNEFIKYVGSYYDIFTHQNKSQFANVYFGDFVGDGKIMVHLTGTQMSPEIDVFDMKTATLSNQQYNWTNKGFGYVEPIPVMKSLRAQTGLFDCGTYCKITYETMNVKGTIRTILVSHLDEDDGTFLENRYDNNTGVWLAGIMTVKEENKTVTNELHIVDSNIYDHSTIVVSPNVQPITSILTQNQNLTIQQSNLSTGNQSNTNQLENKSFSGRTLTTSQNNNENLDPASVAAGLFILIGLPAIIIFVIVWKLRKYLAKRRNNKLETGT